MNIIPDILKSVLPPAIQDEIPDRMASLIAEFPKDIVKDSKYVDMGATVKDYLVEAGYPEAFFSSVLLPLLLFTLSKQKNSPKTGKTFDKEYDYIVVGAGAGGAVMASRLSEMSCKTVLLLEAGKEPPMLTDVPALGGLFLSSDIDWNYYTVPQKKSGRGLKNKQQILNAGKCLGGSGILNGMFAVRGNSRDYDNWEKHGAKGWSYKDVKPYFIKLENNTNSKLVKNGYHGVGGPMTISNVRYRTPFVKCLRKAATELKYEFVDSNAKTQTGFFDTQSTVREGQRCSTAKAYLVPAEDRKNLRILEKAMVTKILIKDKTATGVEFDFQGKKQKAMAKSEVILSAGSIGTPQLMLLSGIGPADHLKKLNINLEADLPVGENLQEHVASAVFFSFSLEESLPVLLTEMNPLNQIEYIHNRSNIFAGIYGGQLLAFLSSEGKNPKDDWPDYELYFNWGPDFVLKRMFNLEHDFGEKLFAPYLKQPFFFCLSQCSRPKSRGTVRLNSTNPYDPPLIDPNFFDDPADLDVVVAGMKMCRKLANTKALKGLGTKEFTPVYPGCEDKQKDEDAYLKCMAETFTLNIWHKSGTARMGDVKDNTTVVDPDLKVKNIKNLRVVDASVIPFVTSGNTFIPIIMMAEKISDMMKKDIKCDKVEKGAYGSIPSDVSCE